MCGSLLKQKIPRWRDFGRPLMGLSNLSQILVKSSLKSYLLSPETVPSRMIKYACIITLPFDPP